MLYISCTAPPGQLLMQSNWLPATCYLFIPAKHQDSQMNLLISSIFICLNTGVFKSHTSVWNRSIGKIIKSKPPLRTLYWFQAYRKTTYKIVQAKLQYILYFANMLLKTWNILYMKFNLGTCTYRQVKKQTNKPNQKTFGQQKFVCLQSW